jgi:disulfide bond formation protein DsbB
MDASGRPILAGPPRNVMRAAALVLAFAAATILAALGFQYVGGYAPCPICLEERYAYYFAIPVAALAVLLARGEATGIARILLLVTALAFIANVGLAVFHAGVEWKWWPGPTECSGAFDLKWGKGGVVDTPVIRCDEASFRFLGLSFAGWDALVSAFIALVALWGAAQKRASRDFQAE